MSRIVCIFVIGIAFASSSGVIAQSRTSKEKRTSTNVGRNSPSVYLDFVKLVETKMPDQDGMESRIWLRLGNNTRWNLVLDASGTEKSLGDAKLYFDVIGTEDIPIVSVPCHSCSIIRLRAGQSIVFSFPAQYLSRAKAVRVEFNYEWEDMNLISSGKEPTHYVFWYAKTVRKNYSKCRIDEGVDIITKGSIESACESSGLPSTILELRTELHLQGLGGRALGALGSWEPWGQACDIAILNAVSIQSSDPRIAISRA